MERSRRSERSNREVKGEKPDPAVVDEVHARYVAALRALHAAHVKDRVLVIL